ncbi:MAG: Lipid export ATP-binding/permease protein MsbA [Myxococcaceae bacterium]|nr:Lipid export ATP-binding/permease protein MsbA [Myxococcaceae bacterium]
MTTTNLDWSVKANAAVQPGGDLTGMKPLWRLLGYVRPHRKYAVLTVIFGTSGFLLSFVYPWIIGNVIDLSQQPGQPGRIDRLIFLTEIAAVTGLLHALVVYGRGHFSMHLGDAIVTDLRRALFEHLQALSVRFYAQQRTGTILSRVLNDVQVATQIIYMGVVVAALDATQLLLAFVFLVHLSPKLALACGGAFPLYGIVFWVMNPRVRQASDRVRGQLSRISGDMAERLAGQALIKTYTAEQRETRRFSKDIEVHHQLVVNESHEGHLVSALGEAIVHLGTTVVIGYGGYLVLQGELTPGMMTRFLGYVVILYGPVRRFAELNITYQSSLSAIRRIFQIFEIEPAIREAPDAHRSAPTMGKVEYRDVRFRYMDGSHEARVHLDDDESTVRRSVADPPWILKGVTFTAEPGERIAVVGTSGAGKTTLLALLPRLYDVTQGEVVVDDIDVRHYSLHALRSAIAIVQQDSFVFSGTIRDNIAYGRPDASEAEIHAAAIAAHAHSFITSFEEGYDTLLGERGVNLSGGQRQRLSIARAIVKNPRILILDEATSSLDSESESAVQLALDELMRGRTCFIIAHRLSTIRNADRILVLQGGRVVETGTHRELLAQRGVYAQFIAKQAPHETLLDPQLPEADASRSARNGSAAE